MSQNGRSPVGRGVGETKDGSMSPVISVVVPLHNEEQNVRPLVEAIDGALAGIEWELLLIDDGSVDATLRLAEEIASTHQRVRVLELARNYGQTAAMQAGFDHARGRVVVSMDGDLQNDPRDIPMLVAELERGYDLVAGYRLRRQDKLVTRKVPSWIANRIIRWVTGIPIRDNGCSLKAYRRELIERMHLYSDMHRFIPAMAAATAGARITEVPVRHHARRHGSSKYGLSRVFKVVIDLLTIKMIRSVKQRPFLFFASGGVVALLVATVFGTAALLAYATFRPAAAVSIVFPGVALVWFGLACYLMMLGLVAEVAVSGELDAVQDLPVTRELAP